MAYKTNLDKAKTAKQEIDARNASFGPKNSVKWYRMEGKKARLRLMPAWTDEGPFALQSWRIVEQHWNVSEDSRGPTLCPKKTPHLGGDCPICDFVDQLRERKDDPEALELAKSIKAKQAYLFTVLDMEDPTYTAKDVREWTKGSPDKECPFEDGDAKLQVYAAPYTVYSNVISILEQGEDIFDLEEGHDIVIEKTTKGGDQYAKYIVTPVMKKTDISHLVSLDHPLVDLAKVGFVNTFDKLTELLAGGVKGAFEEGKEEAPKALPKASKTVAQKTKKAVVEEDDEELPAAGGDDDEDIADLERRMNMDD